MAEKVEGKAAGWVAKVKKRLPVFSICIAVVAICIGMLWRHYANLQGGTADLISSMENELLDLRFKLRGTRTGTGKVGILAIDEKSLIKFGRWPIARKNYEKIFANLKKLGAEWIGFDVVWSEPERPLLEDVADNVERLNKLATKGVGAQEFKDKAAPELTEITDVMQASRGDRSLADAIKNYGKIVLGYIYYGNKFEAEQLSKPYEGLEPMLNSAIQAVVLPDSLELKSYPQFKTYGIASNTDFMASHAEHFAFFNNELSADAIFRWVQLVRDVKGNLMPALALKVAAQALGREPVVVFDAFGIAEVMLVNPEDDKDLIKIPVDLAGNGRMLLNHLGPRMSLPHISIADVYDMNLTAAQKKQLKGMSLLLGPTAVGINDLRANPFDAGFDGVEQHATVVDNIISGKFMRRTERVYSIELGVLLGIGLLFAPLMIFGKAVFSGVAAMLFLVGYFYFDKFFWFGKGEWVYMGMPCIEIISLYVGTTLYKYMTEERERKKTRGVLSLYLSPDVTKQVLEDGGALKLGGEKKELTVFFSDVRSFTTISESLTPEKLCELMNEYFTPMADIIQQTQGVLDKYIGDAIMAFWGAPLQLPNHPDTAAEASLRMLVALDKLRQDLPKKGFPVIDIGIGLNTGSMSVGNMGSPQRFCYTVMGDSVNLGARLEGLTKEYGVKIMISEFTAKRLTKKELRVRDLDDIRVKGKLEPVKVFELLRPDVLKSEIAIQNLVGEFSSGREAYRLQDWEAARKHFMACMQLRPDDGPSELYLRRIEEYQSQPKIDGWDGVYTFKHK